MDAQGSVSRDNNWTKTSELPKLQQKYKNPYDPPFHMWPPEVLAAFQTFPKNDLGMNLPVNDSTWAQWRAWAKQYHDRRHLWPAYLLVYIDERKRKETLKERQGG